MKGACPTPSVLGKPAGHERSDWSFRRSPRWSCLPGHTHTRVALAHMVPCEYTEMEEPALGQGSRLRCARFVCRVAQRDTMAVSRQPSQRFAAHLRGERQDSLSVFMGTEPA